MSYLDWLHRREHGFLPRVGDKDFIMQRVYTSINAYNHWNEFNISPDLTTQFGSIFNLEFSPEGNVLIAACEKQSIALFDVITTKQTAKILDAHTDNVNCVRFLDDCMFATCSDDSTVALWDLRYLKSKVRSLHGHSNWVKNIEYSHKDNLLVSSGFDGSIFTWDINSHTEQGLIYQKVFHTSGLMRCRISPDNSKLVICTTGGYLMIIHNLDLTTLHKDLCGFRPSIYRLMQMGNQYIPQAAKFDHVFSRKQKKNRVELVTDFPAKNDAEIILALQIHPDGHSFLSRNISYDEKTEWSCIHNIMEEPGDITERIREPNVKRMRLNINESSDDEQAVVTNESTNPTDNDVLLTINPASRSSIRTRVRSSNNSRTSLANSGNATPSTSRPETFVPDIWAAEVTLRERAVRQNRARTSNSVTGYSFVYAMSSGVLSQALNNTNSNNRLRVSAQATAAHSPENQNIDDTLSNDTDDTLNNSNISTSSTVSEPPPRIHCRLSLRNRINRREHKIFQNAKKLLYYIEESNKGKGFIKEPCYSSDGRIICSPYENGIRLLGYSAKCIDYPYRISESDTNTIRPSPEPLVVIKTIESHDNVVLCSKFSPREPLLVAGCRGGKIVWYHPSL